MVVSRETAGRVGGSGQPNRMLRTMEITRIRGDTEEGAYDSRLHVGVDQPRGGLTHTTADSRTGSLRCTPAAHNPTRCSDARRPGSDAPPVFAPRSGVPRETSETVSGSDLGGARPVAHTARTRRSSAAVLVTPRRPTTVRSDPAHTRPVPRPAWARSRSARFHVKQRHRSPAPAIQYVRRCPLAVAYDAICCFT
jgi:hypothetical protein